MKGKQRAGLGLMIIVLLITTVLYPVLLYTDNAFVSKWRTLYIETAMSTMTHQWLATAIIPQSIIDEVMLTREDTTEMQKTAESTWSIGDVTSAIVKSEEVDDDEERFYTLFDELDRDSFESYVEKNPNVLAKGWDKIAIDKCDESKAPGIKTKQGDNVLAISAGQGIMIVEVKGETYVGRLAVVKDASRVELAACKRLFKTGQYLSDIADDNDAILAINASGFIDEGGTGNGGTPYGYLKIAGEEKQDAYEHGYKIIGFDEDDLLQIGDTSIAGNLWDAIEFGPALIVDGESKLKSASSGWGLQPRTAIGQASDKTVLMLVIDGRSTRSAGATVGDCKEILESYGAEQACNLDGGSSSVMYYNGREITHPTTASDNPKGRHLPDAFIVTWKR